VISNQCRLVLEATAPVFERQALITDY